MDHPDLQAQLLSGYDAVDLAGVAPNPGWHFEGDFLSRDNDPQDEVGHGTHVAGTIGALTDNSVGVAGVVWQCKILPVKVLARMVKDSDPSIVTGVGTATDIATGIRWAADHGAHIINLSLGGYNDTFPERDAVAYAVSKGCLVVAAMGNDDVSTPFYPAAYPDVVSVGAINQNDQRVSKANTADWWGSNMGEHIDVVAPGLNIRSTDWDNGYSYKSGTSMAAPHVSGVAALIKSCNPGLTAAQMADILRDTARALQDDPADPVPNERYGHGLVDAQAAVARACPTPTCQPFAPRPIRCWPFGTRPTDCRPYAIRPVDCRPYSTRPVDCRPYSTRPVDCRPYSTRPVDCRPYSTRPTRCRPYSTRPTRCRPYASRPTLCLPFGSRPNGCWPQAPRPKEVCPEGGGRPIIECPEGGGRPLIECPEGGGRPLIECPEGGGRPIVECPGGGARPFIECPGGGARPFFGPMASQAGYADEWGEYDPADEYEYDEWTEEDWIDYDPWYGGED
jgi:hypothetical protein